MATYRSGGAMENWTAWAALIVSLCAFWLGYKNRQDIIANKALDLRVQLKREIIDTNVCIDQIPALIHEVGNLRALVGDVSKSANVEYDVWEYDRGRDIHLVELLHERLALISKKQNAQTPKELEQMLIDTHAIKSEALQIRNHHNDLIEIYEKQWGDVKSLLRHPGG
jgi:hypothetical protein